MDGNGSGGMCGLMLAVRCGTHRLRVGSATFGRAGCRGAPPSSLLLAMPVLAPTTLEENLSSFWKYTETDALDVSWLVRCCPRVTCWPCGILCNASHWRRFFSVSKTSGDWCLFDRDLSASDRDLSASGRTAGILAGESGWPLLVVLLVFGSVASCFPWFAHRRSQLASNS